MGQEDPKNRTISSVNRRSVLKKATASMAVFPGVGSQLSSAKESGFTPEQQDRFREIMKQYETRSSTFQAILQHGSEVLNALQNEGVISGAVEDVSRPFHESHESFRESFEGMYVVGMLAENGNPTAHIVAQWFLEGRKITLVVRPEASDAYAAIRPADSNAGSRRKTRIRIDSNGQRDTMSSADTTASEPCPMGEGCLCVWCDQAYCCCENYEIECCPNGACSTYGSSGGCFQCSDSSCSGYCY